MIEHAHIQQENQHTTPRVSICIEFDNFQYIKDRSIPPLFMLIKREIDFLADKYDFEVIIAVDPSCFTENESDILEELRAMSLGASAGQVLNVTGGYYEQKMRAAKVAQSNVLVFVDCDVIPDVGWLRSLLSAMDDESVQIVCGRTYVLPLGAFSKLCSEIWLFDGSDEMDYIQNVRQVSSFHANNFAIRKSVFERFCFPSFHSFRGQCRAAAHDMGIAGVKIWCTSAAKVAHPAPAGIFAYLLRAFRRGFDLFSIGRYLEINGMEWVRHISAGIDRNLKHPFKRLHIASRDYRISKYEYFAAANLIVLSLMMYGFGCAWAFSRIRGPGAR